MVGLPECQLALSQAVTYVATAPKSNAATLAIGKARGRALRPHLACEICATAITQRRELGTPGL